MGTSPINDGFSSKPCLNTFGHNPSIVPTIVPVIVPIIIPIIIALIIPIIIPIIIPKSSIPILIPKVSTKVVQDFFYPQPPYLAQVLTDFGIACLVTDRAELKRTAPWPT